MYLIIKRIGIGIVAAIIAFCGVFLASMFATSIEDQRVLHFATWSASPVENMIYDRIIEEFTNKTGIYVERESFSQHYLEIMSKQFRNHDGYADVFLVSPALYDYWQANDWLLPLDDLISDEEQADYWPIFNEEFRSEDGAYAIPRDLSTLMLYKNQMILQNLNISNQSIPNNITDFVTFLIDLQSKLPEGITALVVDAKYENFMPILAALDKEAYDTYSMGSVDGIDDLFAAIRQLIDAKAVVFTSDQNAAEAFRNEKAVFTVQGNWFHATLEHYWTPFHYEVSKLPTIYDQEMTTAILSAYAVAAETHYPEEAKEFVEFLTTEVDYYLQKNGKSVPAKQSTTYRLQNPKYQLAQIQQELSRPLRDTAVWMEDVHSMMYSYFFANKFFDLVNEPDQIHDIFEQMKQDTDTTHQFIVDLNLQWKEQEREQANK
ncbi:MAG: ABC transporter substrate-binding protein [Culicoidibacterales bacterium]